MKRFLLGAVAFAVLIAGCTAASHLKTLQPPAVPPSPPLALPSAASPVTAGFERGIDIDAYTYPGQNIASAAVADVAYIRSLHANAVSISFPFFMPGPASSTVFAKNSTPTPGQLAVLISDAENSGLRVTLRPLLDETALGISRVHWSPAVPHAWFASYRRFLLPYAAMAQREHVQEFIVGAEFSAFSALPQWKALDRAVRARFHGTLGCANNWSAPTGAGFAGRCGAGVTETVDAYRPVLGSLLPGWEAFDRTLPPGTVETEVGIDAVAGAYLRPYQHQWTAATSLDQQVQAHWFTAACHAATRTHLGGIYFWPLGFSAQAATQGPTLTYQGQWAGGAGARAISRCFAALARGGK